jgi:hypothetical protein
LLRDLEFECVLRVKSCCLLVSRHSRADFRNLNLCVLAEGFVPVCQLSISCRSAVEHLLTVLQSPWLEADLQLVFQIFGSCYPALAPPVTS